MSKRATQRAIENSFTTTVLRDTPPAKARHTMKFLVFYGLSKTRSSSSFPSAVSPFHRFVQRCCCLLSGDNRYFFCFRPSLKVLRVRLTLLYSLLHQYPLENRRSQDFLSRPEQPTPRKLLVALSRLSTNGYSSSGAKAKSSYYHVVSFGCH